MKRPKPNYVTKENNSLKMLRRTIFKGILHLVRETSRICECEVCSIVFAVGVKGKGKGMVLYSAISSPLDRSKRFTISCAELFCVQKFPPVLGDFVTNPPDTLKQQNGHDYDRVRINDDYGDCSDVITMMTTFTNLYSLYMTCVFFSHFCPYYVCPMHVEF